MAKTGIGMSDLFWIGNYCRFAYGLFELKRITMKKNMGGLDRIIRFVVAAIVGVLFFTGVLQGTLAYVLLALSGIFVVTSFVSFCPLYALVGLNTCKVKD